MKDDEVPNVPREPWEEVHIVLTANGHSLSTDCWCEPVAIRWCRRKDGQLMKVVEHEDETLTHRSRVINDRTADPCWITKALNGQAPTKEKENGSC